MKNLQVDKSGQEIPLFGGLRRLSPPYAQRQGDIAFTCHLQFDEDKDCGAMIAIDRALSSAGYFVCAGKRFFIDLSRSLLRMVVGVDFASGDFIMKRMSRFRRLSFLTAVGCIGFALSGLTGCTHTQGKEYVFKSEPMGHGPDEYEIYTDRTPRSVHQGEDTVRAGVMILPPVQPLVRTAARQKEVLTDLTQFYEKMYNLDERRAKDIVQWMSTFMQEHRGLAPDQPVAIQSALDTMLRSRERAVKAAAEATDATTKGQIDEAIVKIDEEIVFFRKYVEERPTKVTQYQQKMDELEAANKRMQLWQGRHVRMTNTVEWTRTTNGSADSEINRALGELADSMTHVDDQTKMEVLAMAVNIGGTDAQALLPRVKVVAADEKINPEVRSFAVKAAQSIESQKG